MNIKTKLEKILDVGWNIFPITFLLLSSLTVFSANYALNYYDYYKNRELQEKRYYPFLEEQIAPIFDKNKDGFTSLDEWKEFYKIIQSEIQYSTLSQVDISKLRKPKFEELNFYYSWYMGGPN